MIDKDILTILVKMARKEILAEHQAAAERAGDIPSMPFLILRKIARPLQYTGGLLLGIMVGVMALLINFLFFVWLLHLEF